MKFASVIPFVSLLASTQGADVECQEKTETCKERVKVSIIDVIQGLNDDVPIEVIDAFVAASASCLQCVDKSDAKPLSTADGTVLTDSQCRNRCWCCTSQYCQINGKNWCPTQCHDRYPECVATPGRRYLTEGVDDTTEEYSSEVVNFQIDVCMDDITPLDKGVSSYTDYNQMLADFESELTECYADKETFYNEWSSLCSESGIDLGLMARSSGGSSAVMFGLPIIDKEGAEVVTYNSDGAHQATSNMIFYSALGFIAVAAFAVVGTAVVVKVINNRNAEEEEKAAKWVSEMSAADGSTLNPVIQEEL